jgi:transposase
MDVSMEETSVCVLDGGGNIVFEGKTSSQPDALSKLLSAKASDAARIVLETGSLACWLWHELRGRNFPVICLDARHARAALSMRINKSSRHGTPSCGAIQPIEMDNREKNHDPGRGVPKGS